MTETAPLSNLRLLHEGEQHIRALSIELAENNDRLLLHLQLTEEAMNVLDVFRQNRIEDEDLKVVQMLALRLFNAFGASLKLSLSGYYLFGAQVLRDVIETVFLADLFRTDRAAITRWRHAKSRSALEEFRPVNVRKALDDRDGFHSQKRAELYKLFSELAGHPTMASVAMLRPQGTDATNGPYFDSKALEANLAEAGRLAMQVGELLIAFGAEDRTEFLIKFVGPASTFTDCKRRWLARFYPT